MKDDYLDLFTEEHRNLHEEFTICQDWSEVEEFLKKVGNLNESQENNEIPYYDMSVEEYCKKYGLVSLEEIMDRHGIQ